MGKTEEVLTRGVQQILPDKKGLADLMAKRRIKLYQGFDPSMPSLHLGNFVGLMKLRQFQKLGHEVIFLVGDFTGMIGDPTDKLSTRKKLTRGEVLENAKAWKEQVGKVLDFKGKNPAKIMFNSEWTDKLSQKDLVEIASKLTHQQLIERDMYQERIKEGNTIYFHELLYPLYQGYDCVAMDVDLEIGGNDQLFNMMIGRTLMKAMKGKEKFVLTTKLLVDKEGQKVGKTTGNALFLDSAPEEFFEGIMLFPDNVITLGYELLTEAPLEGIEEKVHSDPFKEKQNLATEVVTILWGKEEAERAGRVFSQRRSEVVPSPEFSEYVLNIRTLSSMPTISAALSDTTGDSISYIKGLMNQNAVRYFDQNNNSTPLTRENDKNTDIISEPGTVRLGRIDVRIEKR